MNQIRIFLLVLFVALATASCADEGAHTHQGFEIPEGEDIPTVELLAIEDPVAGWNLQVKTANFTFAPQRAGREFVLGEGHGHLYVDGEKRDRVYGAWYHLDNLASGEHRVEVTLNGNNHAVYQTNGRPISDEIFIEAAEPLHKHPDDTPLEADPNMEIALSVEEDPVGGLNVFVDTAGFSWAPERAGRDLVPGEGHAHLYVDERKIGRMYGPAVYLGPLDAGSSTITVSLHGNNHAPYVINGKPVADAVTVDVPGEASRATKTLALEIRGGEVVGGVQRVEAALGDTLELVVFSDQAERLHIHGYDITTELVANTKTSVAMVANIPGMFEVELEESGLLLLYFTVR